MVKHNNIVPNVHLRKHWQNRVRTHFNQPAQKTKRIQRRVAKAAAMFPRPVEKLRPVVSSCTRKYAGKTRFGRGFTLAEIKEAGLSATFCRTVGISVDHRRTNTSTEQKQLNVERLNTYKSKLILFPRKENKPKKGMINDATAEQLASAAAKNQVTGDVLPKSQAKPTQQFAAVSSVAVPRTKTNFHLLRTIRVNTRYRGRREKKAAEEAEKKKK